MRWSFICLLLLCLPGVAVPQGRTSAKDRCIEVEVSKGDIGEGRLIYCDNGTDQKVYLSGEMDFRDTDTSERKAVDLIALKQVLRKIKKREKGIFRLVTNNAGGGETAWHQNLIIAVEDACIEDCRIITEIKGRCESACNQLHITCVRNARTILHKAAATCEHASTDEENPKCRISDPNGSGETDLCSSQSAVDEYKQRCGALTNGRGLDIDPDRRDQIFQFIDRLAKDGVFDTTKLTCTPLTWAESDPIAQLGSGYGTITWPPDNVKNSGVCGDRL